jgi:hypothetical protein
MKTLYVSLRVNEGACFNHIMLKLLKGHGNVCLGLHCLTTST